MAETTRTKADLTAAARGPVAFPLLQRVEGAPAPPHSRSGQRYEQVGDPDAHAS